MSESLTIYAAVYDREVYSGYHSPDYEPQYDPDNFYLTREGAQKFCDAMNVKACNSANLHAKRAFDERLREYEKSKVLHEAGLQKWLGTQPQPPIPFTLENLPRESYYIEEAEVHP